MNPKNNISEACTLAPKFGQITDINSSSLEQLHHLGNGSLSVPDAREEGQLIEQNLSQSPSLDILASNQHQQT
ncbi:hypothetical protein PIB30_047007 [Stylosanthes scabra]|uniref:Uncharacterized protein n=1 Tax=Stylosanthes scabra TaxID=79078 RepID=A0ABU6YH49_9FABA|nr:hypothetical protein [Stylosanthes scabra]